jgi:hypothetical protein
MASRIPFVPMRNDAFVARRSWAKWKIQGSPDLFREQLQDEASTEELLLTLHRAWSIVHVSPLIAAHALLRG